MSQSTNTRRTFEYEEIHPDTLSSTDLHTMWMQALEDGAARAISAYRIHIDGEANTAEALLIDWDPDDDDMHTDYREHRMGISWGADATWADVVGSRDGDPLVANVVAPTIDLWLNDADAWEARN